MKVNNKFIVMGTLMATVSLITVAAGKTQPLREHYTNLKVLPKDISQKYLQKIMVDDFEDGLGVSCNFCHAQKKDTTNFELDFASDAKPEKEIARAMMRMTLGINKKYFNAKHAMLGTAGLTVTCNTCHKGEAFPDGGAK